MITLLRKIQKSATGLYINLPKKIIQEMKLTGKEVVKVTYNEDTQEITVKVIDVEE